MRTILLFSVLLSAFVGCDSCSGCDRRAKDKRGSAATYGSAATTSGSGAAVATHPPRTMPRHWAAPPQPTLPALSSAWSEAEAKKTAESWDAVADAYAKERARCTDDCLDAQYAVVLARKNAMAADALPKPKPDEKPPLPTRVQALVESLDDYLKIAPRSDPDVYDMKFLAANALAAWHQDDAVDRLQELLREYRNEPQAEYVANMLIDALVRENRIPELKALVTDLLADSAFLQGKDALRATILTLQAQIAESGQ